VRPTRRERTLVGYRSIVANHLVPAFGTRELRAMSRRDVQAWVSRQTASPQTVKHWVDCLRAAMGKAVLWGLIEANPASRIDMPRIEKHQVRAMRPEDAKAVIAATSGAWFAAMVVVSLYTGIRQGELLGLRWQDVDLKAGTLTVHGSLSRIPGGDGMRYVLTPPKSERSVRTVPLLPAAADALREVQRKQMAGEGTWKGLVFAAHDRPHDGPQLTHDFQDALKAAGMPDMRWHDLRHGTASLLIAQGVSLAVVSSILGHSGIAITVDTYGHLTEDTKRDAIGRLAVVAAG
jgi:integrase